MRVNYTLPGIVEVVVSDDLPITERTRVCITGGRDLTDRKLVFDSLDQIHAVTPIGELAAGCAVGADAMALVWAVRNKVPWRMYCADWLRYDQQAGSLRNEVMLSDFQPILLGVFPGGVGTTHCARTARKMNIERMFFGLNDDPLAEAMKWG